LGILPFETLNIFLIFFVVVIAVFFFLVSNRKKNRPSDPEAFNEALRALVEGRKDEAYHLLREIIAKDSSNVDAFLLLGDIVREKDIEQAIKIHQSVILRPKISKKHKTQAHIALSKDLLKNRNIVRAESELKNILKTEKNNKWALEKLKDISTENKNWKDALNYEKLLMKTDSEHKKNDESMLNYYIAMDYKSNDNLKNYKYYLEKSVACEKIYSDSLLELAEYNTENIDLSITYLKMYAKNKPVDRIQAYNKIENLLFENKRFNDVESLYKESLNEGFDGYALNRLVDILLEKGEKEECKDLVNKFMKSQHECHSIRLNKLKIESSNFELRKSISTLCNEMIKDEIIQ